VEWKCLYFILKITIINLILITMKKFLSFLFLTTFLLGVGCTKDTKLSEFVVGNWKSQTLTLGGTSFGYFTATIKTTNKYVLTFTLSDGSQSISCPEAGYTIDDGKNQITIDQPTFDPATPATGTVTFNVAWDKNVNGAMTWTPTDVTGSDPPPTLVWTRQ
jgi:hypothetical protein